MGAKLHLFLNVLVAAAGGLLFFPGPETRLVEALRSRGFHGWKGPRSKVFQWGFIAGTFPVLDFKADKPPLAVALAAGGCEW